MENLGPGVKPDESPAPTGSAQTNTRTVKALGYTPEFVQSLVGYLQTKPWGEVHGYIQSLSQAAPFDVTITDGKA